MLLVHLQSKASFCDLDMSKTSGKFLYRVDKPRVTETLSKHFMTRDTGHQGTGIYAYGTKTRAEELADGRQIFKIDASKVKFFTPRKVIPVDYPMKDGQNTLKDLSEMMNGAAIAKSFGEEKWYGRQIIGKGWREQSDSLQMNAFLYGERLGFTHEEIERAIERSAKEAKEFGLDKASQPINHLLAAKGYGGIDPGKGLRNDNSVGVVIFRETFKIKAGEMENVSGKEMVKIQ
jgi:hypothetical protein